MTSLLGYSLRFFTMVMSISAVVHVVRTSPLFYSHIGLARVKWRDWLADQVLSRLGIERESFLARLVKVVSIVCKYGIAAWAFKNLENLSLIFWILTWVTLLILEIMRKSAQFHIPAKWENVSLKLDSEHFWLINLILLGVVELHIATPRPYGLASLIFFYIIFSGESKNTILAAIEDIVSSLLGIIAFLFLFKLTLESTEVLAAILAAVVCVRAIVRATLGRTWIKRKFWWIAQFCLMTSLIIKSLEVMGAWTLLTP